MIPNDGKTYVLHHKDSTLIYQDIQRYVEWNIKDLEVMEKSEHDRMHHLGKIPWNFGKTKENSEGVKKQADAITGSNNPFFGKHHSEETKKLISEKRIGKPLPKKKCPYCDTELDTGNLSKHLRKVHNKDYNEEELK